LASVVGGSFGVFAGGFFSDRYFQTESGTEELSFFYRLVSRLGLHSRLWLLSACTIAAAPLATGVLYYDPPAAMGFLIVYYLFAETWFAVLFTVIVEIVEPEVRATCIAVFLFCMNQVGGNLPVIVSPLTNELDDYRSALALVWPGFMALSSLLFFLSSFPLCYLARAHQRRAEIEAQRRQESQAKELSQESQESYDKSPLRESPSRPLLGR